MRYIEATDFVKLEYARRCMPSPWPIIEISAKLLESLGLSPDSPELEYDSPDLPSLKTVCNGLIEMVHICHRTALPAFLTRNGHHFSLIPEIVRIEQSLDGSNLQRLHPQLHDIPALLFRGRPQK